MASFRQRTLRRPSSSQRRTMQTGFPACRSTVRLPTPASRYQERSNGSTPTPSSLWSIRRLGHAIRAYSASRTIIQRSASLATRGATRDAGRTSPIRTYTSRNPFRSGKESSCASTARCSMRSIIQILRCPAPCKRACQAQLLPDSEHSKAPLRHLPGCSAWDSEETLRRA